MYCFVILFMLSLLFFIFVLLKRVFWVSKVPNLNDKHVLITGGSSGIGKSVAIQAAKLGAHVTIMARNPVKLELAAEEIKKVVVSPSQKINTISLDVTKEFNAIEEVINRVDETVCPIYLLVNCAGMAICGVFEDTPESDYRHMMEVNYFGTVFPTLAVAKKMKERNEGHIVITGSQGSLVGIYGMSAYCSSKFALRGFAETLYMELMPNNITVTLCLPPDTNTPGFENEEKSKPAITRIISKTTGLYEPEVVAHQMLSDALNQQFFSVVGFESLLLTTLCSGMSPVKSILDWILHVSFMSFLKLISIVVSFHFRSVILNNVKPVKPKYDVKKTE